MDFLAGLLTGGLHAATPGPTDDHWYNPVGTVTASGLRVDAEGARKISAWFRGREIIATSLAMLPLQVYRRLPNDDGREVASGHPLYDVLHRKPNDWQDKFQYVRAATYDVIDYGWHYSKIIEGPRGFADQLHPIHPTLVTPELTSQNRWIFTVRDPKVGTSRTFTQDDIFYLRGADGKGILDYARESLGLGVTLESYASKLFSNGALSGGIIETPGAMPDTEQLARLARQFVTARGNWHMPKVIPLGATFKPAMMEPEKAQMILSRKFSVVDIARWLGLPAHMLNEVDTAGVTGLEQKGQEFVTFNMGGWLCMWEFGINDQLILVPQTYFAEFTREALVRGDLTARSEADVAYVNAGIDTVDEVRARNNKRKMGGKASELRDPQNITGKGAKGGPQDNRRPGRRGDPEDSKAQAIARSAAGRVLKLEVTAVQRLAVQHANASDAFATAIAEFYAGHQARVVDMLQMSEAESAGYCAGQAAQVLDGWLAALEVFKTDDYAHGLAAWALESEAA